MTQKHTHHSHASKADEAVSKARDEKIEAEIEKIEGEAADDADGDDDSPSDSLGNDDDTPFGIV